LYFNGDSTCIGLFGSSEADGNIKNVGVVDSYFKGNDHVGGVCGNNGGTITNCYNAGNLTAIESSATIGGICGYNNTGTVTNCYNTGTVTATGSVASVGGVCGCSTAPISNCYNIGTVTATSSSADISGICGYNFGPIKNCYYLADTEDENGGKTTEQFASGEVAYLLSQGCSTGVGDDAETYDGSIWGQKLGENGDTYPVLDITKRVYQVDKYDGCEGKPGSSTKVYSNQSTSIYEEHSFAYEPVENGNAIKVTCSECGATYTVKLTQPAATSDEKIVYDGTEKKAGTAIDSGNTGIETIPENAITYAAVTNGTTSTYSTTAPKNAGTYKAKLTLGTGDNIVSIEINFTIEKAASPTIAGEEKSYAYSAGSDGKAIGVDIAGKLPTDRGTTTYAVAETDTEQFLSEVTVDTSGNLTYKVNQVDSTKVGKTAVITVTASMENYENVEYTLTISITDTRSECVHTHTEIRNQREATCTQTGYTGDTYCTDCDKLLSTGKELAALGHNYKATVTKQPTTTEEGIMTYTCSKCGHSYTQPIAKIKSDDSNKDNGSQNQKPQPDTDNGKDNGTSIKPYIKDESGKEGWDVIKPQLEEAKAGDTVTVAMNGTTVVPKDVIDSIKGKDTTLVLDMGNGLSWKIYGKDITDAAGDIDFDVTVGADAGKSIPVDVINNVTGERSSLNLTLAYDGEFGFTATLTVNMESKNAGLYANLFYYNEQTGELEFISAGQIDADGNAELEFTHASDYTIVVDTKVMSDNGQADNKADETIPAPKTDYITSKYAWNNTIIIIIGICIILSVFGAVLYVRKKSGSEEE
jgi:RNase P subunit RPR2